MQVMVIGSTSDELTRGVLSLAESYGLDIVRCEDVYSAVCRLDRSAGGVVVGRIEELCREDGRFFGIARKYGLTCCCFVDDGGAGRKRQLVQAMECRACVVTEIGEIDELLSKLSDGSIARAPGVADKKARGLVGNVVETILGGGAAAQRAAGGASGFMKDEFLMTKAELDALLKA